MSDQPKHLKEDSEAPSNPSPKSDPPIKPARSQSVVIYLTILFAAAFLMLLLAYFMQQRNSNAVIGNLQNSLTSFQTLDELREENQQLRERLQVLEEERDALQSDNDALTQQYTDASNREKRAQAESDLRGTLYAAEYLYETDHLQAAAERLASITGDDLLIISAASDGTVPSDTQRYETLKAALVAAGYLTEDPGSGQLRLTHPEA